MNPPSERPRYLNQQEIDHDLWDESLRKSPGRCIYACSWYLDRITDHWGALVLGDYEAFMPLPWRKKWGIKYLYQPAFFQRSGIFSHRPFTGDLIRTFYQSIPSSFRTWDLNVDASSLPGKGFRGSMKQRTNFILDLHPAYSQIRRGYSDLAERNLSRSSGIGIREYLPPSEAISFFNAHYRDRVPSLRDRDFKRFQELVSEGINKKMAYSLGALDPDGQLIATAIFFDDGLRVTYLMGGLNEAGKTCGALYFLFDHMLKTYSGSGRTFDFEGSDIPGIAFFYERFGAVREYYWNIRIIRWPGTGSLF